MHGPLNVKFIIFVFAPCINSIKATFINPTDAHNYKNTGMLPCTARLHNMLVCRHNLDHVVNDEHNITIIVVLAKQETTP